MQPCWLSSCAATADLDSQHTDLSTFPPPPLPPFCRRWATARVPDARYMNVGSGPQVQQLLFAGATKDASKGRGKAKEAAAEMAVPLERVFKVGLMGGIGSKNAGRRGKGG